MTNEITQLSDDYPDYDDIDFSDESRYTCIPVSEEEMVALDKAAGIVTITFRMQQTMLDAFDALALEEGLSTGGYTYMKRVLQEYLDKSK